MGTDHAGLSLRWAGLPISLFRRCWRGRPRRRTGRAASCGVGRPASRRTVAARPAQAVSGWLRRSVLRAPAPALVDPVFIGRQVRPCQPVGLGEQAAASSVPPCAATIQASASSDSSSVSRSCRPATPARASHIVVQRSARCCPPAARRRRRRPARTSRGPLPRSPRPRGGRPSARSTRASRAWPGRRSAGRRWPAALSIARSRRSPAASRRRRAAARAGPGWPGDAPRRPRIRACGGVGGPCQVRGRVGEPVLGLRQSAQHAPRRGSSPSCRRGARSAAAPRRTRPCRGASRRARSRPTRSAPSWRPPPSSRPRALELGPAFGQQVQRVRRPGPAGCARTTGAAGRRAQLVVADRHAASMSAVARSRLPPDASSQPASSSAGRPVARPGAARRPRRAPSRTRCAAVGAGADDRPRPSRTRWRSAGRAAGRGRRAQASASSMLARSDRAIARCSACSGPRTPVLGPGGGRGEPGRVRARRDVSRPGLAQPLEAELADAVEQPVAHRAAGPDVDADQRAVDEPADHVDGRRRGYAERAEDVFDRGQRRPAGEARPAPTGRAGRRGTAGRSSRPGRRAASAGAAGRWLVGSLSRVNRSPSRRAISSTDSALTRAAASSMASGRPSSERHTSSMTGRCPRPGGTTGAAARPARRTGRPRR